MPSLQGPHPLYKLKKNSLVPDKDPLCAAVQAGSVHNHNHKGPSQQCDYYVEYADQSSSIGVLVRDIVWASLTNKTWLTENSVFGYVFLLLISLFVSDGIHFFQTTIKTVKIIELWNLITDILDHPENVTTYLKRPDRPSNLLVWGM